MKKADEKYVTLGYGKQYYIRRVIPIDIRRVLNISTRTVTRCLRTTELDVALKRAEPINRYIDNLINKFKEARLLTEIKQIFNPRAISVDVLKNIKHELKIDKIEVGPDGHFLIEGLELDPNKLEEENAAFQQIVATVRKETPRTDGKITLKRLIELYLKEKHFSGAWDIHSVEGNERNLLRFAEIVGDKAPATL